MERNREEHLKYCKENAYKQYEYDLSGKEYSEPNKAIQNACTTMLCDLAKHPETEKLATSTIFLAMSVDSDERMRQFIDGFN